jgi:hypothetical protein
MKPSEGSPDLLPLRLPNWQLTPPEASPRFRALRLPIPLAGSGAG